MRVRPLILIVFWGAVFIWVGYNGMQAISSYFQVNDVVEQAFREASEKQRQRNPGELLSSELTTDVRAGLLAGARRLGLEVDPANVKAIADGGLVRVTVGWTYRTWPLTTWGWDTGVPIPLWFGRSFDPQLGMHRLF